MTQFDDAHHETDASPSTDGRYVGFSAEESYVVYDTEEETAWIQSDTTVGRGEMA